MKPKLQVCRVSFSYHSKEKETLALSDISFTVDSGEFVVIVGPSGCGKSTLLSLLCGLDEPESGAIFLDGELLEKIPKILFKLAICSRKTSCLNGEIFFQCFIGVRNPKAADK